MSGISEHRLYQYLSEPIRLMGMTLDELFGGLGLLGAGLLSSSVALQGTLYLWSVGWVIGLKKFKKLGAGTDLRAFLYWQGIWPAPSKAFPPFCDRVWLS